MTKKKSKNSKKQKKESPVNKSEQNKLAEAKIKLNVITEILDITSQALPSLVSTKVTKDENDIHVRLQKKFETDSGLISMLEDFFEKLVLLLRYRSSYDEKLSQLSRHIEKLSKTKTIVEFQSKLQLLGILLHETEQIVRNYEEMYQNLFNEQALLQFQLMEQLAMFKEKDVPNFAKLFEDGIKCFMKLNDELAHLDEN